MKINSREFKLALLNSVKEVENNSNTEIIVIISKKSSDYSEYVMGLSFLFSFLSLIVMLFSEYEFHLDIIVTTVFLIFIGGISIFMLFPKLFSFMIPQKLKQRNVNIMAHACFSKAKVYKTAKNTGILIYVSKLEKKAVMLVDEGIENCVPHDDIEALRKKLSEIFYNKKLPQAILDFLSSDKDISVKRIMSQYIPPVENDINELPDEFDLNFDKL